MNGHIHKRAHSAADGRMTTTWYVIVDVGRDKNGRRRQKWHGGYRTRREAEAVRAKLVNQIHRGEYVTPTKTTLAEWVYDAYLVFAKTRLKASTWASYKRTLELHILPTLGDEALSDITSTTLNQLYATLLENGKLNGGGGGLSNRSVRYAHAIIRKVLADAIDAGLIATNPAVNAKPPKAVRSAAPGMNFWTAEELARFLHFVKDHELEMAFHLLAYTGMRRGEALGLRWEDVDLESGRLSIRHALVSIGYAVRDEAPKSHKARVVDVDRHTTEKLRRLRDPAASARSGSDALWTKRPVVTTTSGSPVHPDRLTKVFDELVRRSGLRRIRLHDYADLCVMPTRSRSSCSAGVPRRIMSA